MSRQSLPLPRLPLPQGGIVDVNYIRHLIEALETSILILNTAGPLEAATLVLTDIKGAGGILRDGDVFENSGILRIVRAGDVFVSGFAVIGSVGTVTVVTP